MTDRIGLGLGRGAVRAVVVRRGKVTWIGSTIVEENEELQSAITRMLRQIPVSRWRRRRVRVAVGPAATQVKHLTSLPPSRNERVLGQAVAANVGRFFLRNGIPLRVTSVRLDPIEGVWAAAIEAPVTNAIEAACRECRIRYDGAVPAVMVVGAALGAAEGGCFVSWSDHDVVAALELESGRLVRTRRMPPNGTSPSDAPVVNAALREIDAGGWELADAYGAAVADLRESLLLRPSTDQARQRRLAAARRGVLLLSIGVIGMAALLAPGLIAARAQRVASARLTQLASRQREVASTQATLTQLSKALQRTADFRGDRPPMTGFVAHITEALPESTAMLTLRVDSAGGAIVALSRKGAEVLAAVRQTPGVSLAQITAPLTRETVEATEVERVSIRFQFPRAARPIARPAPKEAR